MIVQSVSSVGASVILTQRELIALRAATSCLTDSEPNQADLSHALYGTFEALILGVHLAGDGHEDDTVHDAIAAEAAHHRAVVAKHEANLAEMVKMMRGGAA